MPEFPWSRTFPPGHDEVPTSRSTRAGDLFSGKRCLTTPLVNTKEAEFDYPKGDSNVYTEVRGGGAASRSPHCGKRFAFAWRYGHHKILLTDAITDKSRVIITAR